MQSAYTDFLSESGRSLVERATAFLESPDVSKVREYLALFPIRKKEMYADGIRAIYEPSFEEPLICALLALGEAGLETLYWLITHGGYHWDQAYCIELLYSVGRQQQSNHVADKIEFLRRYVDDQIIDNVARDIQKVYANAELALKARELIAKAVQYAITNTSRRDILQALFGLAEDQEIKFLVEVITRNTLSISDEVCDDFQALVNQDLNEAVYQDFLRKNPALIDPLASSIVDRQDLADEWKTDFVIRRLDNQYIFVEIEKPRDKPFNKYPAPSSTLSHALGQVLNWFIWIEDHISYARTHGFPIIHVPKGVVVIGRSSDLGTAQARMLHALNDALYPRIVILTFDDLIVNARNVVANLMAKPDSA